MAKHINGVSRILGIIEPLVQVPDDQQTVMVWAKAFSIESGQVLKVAQVVATRLGCMQRELNAVSRSLAAKGLSEHLYSKALSDIESAISPMLLSTSWHNIKQYFPEANLVALRFCSEILPDEEAEISPDDLATICARVSELRELVTGAKLSDRVRDLILHQLDLIEQALAEYPIAGVKALREAFHRGVGEIVEANDALKTERDAPTVSKLGELWKTFFEILDKALKAEQAVQLGQKIYEAIVAILP